MPWSVRQINILTFAEKESFQILHQIGLIVVRPIYDVACFHIDGPIPQNKQIGPKHTILCEISSYEIWHIMLRYRDRKHSLNINRP